MPKSKTVKPAVASKSPAAEAPKATKLDLLISLLRRPNGATLEQMVAATGWQRHSVRGAMAGGLKAKLGAKVLSEKIDGVRRYRAPRDGQ